MNVSRSSDLNSKAIHASFEDIRLKPESSLLRELDDMDFRFLMSYSVVEEDLDFEQYGNEMPALLPELHESNTHIQHDQGIAHFQENDTGDPSLQQLELDSAENVADLFQKECTLWTAHPSNNALFSISKPFDRPEADIGPISSLVCLTKEHDPPRPDKDIGNVPIRPPPNIPYKLDSSEQEVLKWAYSMLGDQTISEARLEFLPRWIIDKSISKEKANYATAYEELDIASLPKEANLISSHHFFQVKHEGEKDKLKLKCRLVSHGNRDKEKDYIRKDSATAQFPIIRVVLSLVAVLQLSVATIDIKKAYMQGGYLSRDIYMRPPKGWASSSRKIWKLLKPAYGLVESGRILLLAIESWLKSEGIYELPGFPQLFISRTGQGNLKLVLAKVVDDFLIAAAPAELQAFNNRLSQKFEVGRFITGNTHIFNRLHITVADNYSVHVSIAEYMEKIEGILLDRSRRKQFDSQVTSQELRDYQKLCGSLNFIGDGILPQASYVASYLQQNVPRLTVSGLVTANHLLRDLKTLDPSTTYRSPPNVEFAPAYLAFSDASMGRSAYGQTGYLSGIYMPMEGDYGFYHVLDWVSGKQRRVSFSSIGAEILAAATSTDRGALMAERIGVLNGRNKKLPFVLSVDSNGIYTTITTLHEGADYRLRPTVSRLRDSFENGEIEVMQCVRGVGNLADALTKRNLDMFKKLNKVMTDGIIRDVIFNEGKRVTRDAEPTVKHS